MGEVAEMILDGTLCQSCGVFISEGKVFPRECAYCRSAGKSAGKVACPVCKKKVKGLNDHIRDAHPGHAEREKATHETATRDMLDSARADLEMLREALGVPAEPHQSLIERMVEAAQAKRGAVPEFSDSARAALLWVLWHHQGGSSPVGQPIRFALGMGQHEHLNDWQVAEAKRWGKLRGEPKPAKCDGNHGGPRCADPECWQDPVDDVIDVRMAAERLVKRALAVGVVLTIETQPRQPLAMGNYDLVVQTREVRNG